MNELLDRGRAVVARATNLPPVAALNRVMQIYGAAGGGLLAAGLAYGALVALLPGFLLFIGLLGLVISEPTNRENVIASLSAQIPPLAALVRDGITSIVEWAGASSIVGLLGLAWGTSRFYGSIDEAFARIFVHASPRGFVERLLRGFVSVALLIGGFAGVLVVTAAQQFMVATLPVGEGGGAMRTALRLGVPLVAAGEVTLVVAAVYRLVPNVHVPLRALAPPALVVGIVLTLLTQVFVFIAPRLVGSLAVFGGFAAVFAALAWLSLGFQALLMGAAWTRERVPARDPGARPSGSDNESRTMLRTQP